MNCSILEVQIFAENRRFSSLKKTFKTDFSKLEILLIRNFQWNPNTVARVRLQPVLLS